MQLSKYAKMQIKPAALQIETAVRQLMLSPVIVVLFIFARSTQVYTQCMPWKQGTAFTSTQHRSYIVYYLTAILLTARLSVRRLQSNGIGVR